MLLLLGLADDLLDYPSAFIPRLNRYIRDAVSSKF